MYIHKTYDDTKVTSAWGAAANPPMGMTGASGKFNRFFNRSLSCATSIRLRALMSLAILSIFGSTGLSAPDGGGGCGRDDDGVESVAAAALVDSTRRIMLNTSEQIYYWNNHSFFFRGMLLTPESYLTHLLLDFPYNFIDLNYFFINLYQIKLYIYIYN